VTLASRLEAFDGRAITLLSQAQAAHRGDAGFLEELVRLSCSGEGHVGVGASWILKDELEAGARLSGGDAARLVAGLEKVGAWQAQLHLCQCLEYVEFCAEQAVAVSDWARKFQGHERPFLRAWSLHLRIVLARRFSSLAADAAVALAVGAADDAGSVRARMRRLA